MKITGSTRVVGIFGDPVVHTLSPAMHNAAFESLGLDMVYIPFHVRSEPLNALEKALAGVRALDLRGLNITIPHKERALGLVDELDDNAREIGAINTVVNRDGRLFGYNTDGAGYLLSLKDEAGFTPAGKNIVIIGAGGASRSILYSILASGPASVILTNRTFDRAEALVNEFAPKFIGVKFYAVPFEPDALEAHFKDADLVVNTTSIGMMGRGELDIPLGALPRRAIVSDIVYKPLETGLLKKAGTLGLKTHGGLGMLVRQGAIGFELWTGRVAPIGVMQKAAMAALGIK